LRLKRLLHPILIFSVAATLAVFHERGSHD